MEFDKEFQFNAPKFEWDSDDQKTDSQSSHLWSQSSALKKPLAESERASIFEATASSASSFGNSGSSIYGSSRASESLLKKPLAESERASIFEATASSASSFGNSGSSIYGSSRTSGSFSGLSSPFKSSSDISSLVKETPQNAVNHSPWKSSAGLLNSFSSSSPSSSLFDQQPSDSQSSQTTNFFQNENSAPSLDRFFQAKDSGDSFESPSADILSSTSSKKLDQEILEDDLDQEILEDDNFGYDSFFKDSLQTEAIDDAFFKDSKTENSVKDSGDSFESPSVDILSSTSSKKLDQEILEDDNFGYDSFFKDSLQTEAIDDAFFKDSKTENSVRDSGDSFESPSADILSSTSPKKLNREFLEDDNFGYDSFFKDSLQTEAVYDAFFKDSVQTEAIEDHISRGVKLPQTGNLGSSIDTNSSVDQQIQAIKKLSFKGDLGESANDFSKAYKNYKLALTMGFYFLIIIILLFAMLIISVPIQSGIFIFGSFAAMITCFIIAAHHTQNMTNIYRNDAIIPALKAWFNVHDYSAEVHFHVNDRKVVFDTDSNHSNSNIIKEFIPIVFLEQPWRIVQVDQMFTGWYRGCKFQFYNACLNASERVDSSIDSKQSGTLFKGQIYRFTLTEHLPCDLYITERTFGMAMLESQFSHKDSTKAFKTGYMPFDQRFVLELVPKFERINKDKLETLLLTIKSMLTPSLLEAFLKLDDQANANTKMVFTDNQLYLLHEDICQTAFEPKFFKTPKTIFHSDDDLLSYINTDCVNMAKILDIVIEQTECLILKEDGDHN